MHTHGALLSPKMFNGLLRFIFDIPSQGDYFVKEYELGDQTACGAT